MTKRKKSISLIVEHECFGESVRQVEKTCPRFGGKLVVRMAKRGEHVGNQFYGCENFPKCWYREDI